MGAGKHPDYAKIARLERELGIGQVAPMPEPRPVWPAYPVPSPHPPSPPPSIEPVPDDALYRCRFCGNRVRAGSTACTHCGAQEWVRDDDY